MAPLDEWVAHANITKLKDQMNDPAFIGLTAQLTRLIVQADRNLEGMHGPPYVAARFL